MASATFETKKKRGKKDAKIKKQRHSRARKKARDKVKKGFVKIA